MCKYVLLFHLILAFYFQAFFKSIVIDRGLMQNNRINWSKCNKLLIQYFICNLFFQLLMLIFPFKLHNNQLGFWNIFSHQPIPKVSGFCLETPYFCWRPHIFVGDPIFLLETPYFVGNLIFLLEAPDFVGDFQIFFETPDLCCETSRFYWETPDFQWRPLIIIWDPQLFIKTPRFSLKAPSILWETQRLTLEIPRDL